MPFFSTLLIHRLSSYLRRRTGVTPDVMLPIELWNCIFEDLADDDLLSICGTCRAFNDLCMPKYLLLKGITSLSLESGDLSIESNLIKPLHLSFYSPPIQSLSCRFWVYKIHAHLQSLRNLLDRAKSIRNLELTFYESLSRCHRTASRWHAPVSQKTILTLFRDIVYSMSKRFDGPVVIVDGDDIFSCRPRDIRRWNLQKLHFAGGLRNYIHSAFLSPSPRRTTIRLHDGTSANIWTLPPIVSAHIYEVPSITKAPGVSSTLIILNRQTITSLVLGYSESSTSYSIPGTELSVILPHITLPVLDRITLNTESIDPVVLSQFLSRHKTLSWLSFNGVSHKTPSCLLITPTLALPNLHLIESSDPANFISLLDALDASPELSIFRFPFDRSSPNSIAALNSLLRRLGRHTGTDIGLQLTLTTSQSRPLDEAERAIASALACVRQVQMAVERREVALEMVPWLALLPGLHFVDFGLCMVGAPVDEKRRFMQEVRAALPATVVIRFPP